MSANAFSVQLDGKRVRVVLESRRRGGVLHARFYWQGKPIWRSTKSADWTAAKAKAEQFVIEESSRPLAITESRPLQQLLTQFLETRWPGESTKPQKEKHYLISKQRLEHFIEFTGHETDFAAITFDEGIHLVQRYLDSRKHTMQAQTIINDKRAISIFYAWLVRTRIVSWQANPANRQFLSLPKVHREPRAPISTDELSTLLKAAKKSKIWPAVLLCLTTGLRPVGTLRISRDDIDFDGGKLRVSEKSRVRLVPLNAWVLSELWEWTHKHRGKMLLNVTGHDLHETIRKIRVQHGLRPEVTLQGCRRTFISHAMDAGIPAELVASIAGNSIKVIERHYKDLRTMDAAAVVDKLDFRKYFDSKRSKRTVAKIHKSKR